MVTDARVRSCRTTCSLRTCQEDLEIAKTCAAPTRYLCNDRSRDNIEIKRSNDTRK